MRLPDDQQQTELKTKYKIAYKLATELLSRVEKGIDGHAEAFLGDPENWGYLGNLHEVISKLREISDSLFSEGDHA